MQAKLAKPMKAERHSIMRKIINGRKYKTKTAECVGEMASTYNFNDGYYYWEELYRKRTGEFFLHGAGNGLSPYAQSVGMGSTSGENIFPISEEDARKWGEKYMSVGEYESIFGEVEE